MRLFITVALVLLLSAAFAQSGYRIDVTVKNWKDTTVYLGFYQGESTFLRDTARVNAKGEFVFDGKKELPQGVYFVVLGKSRIFDFVIAHDQNFKLETTGDDYVKNMKVSGDEDNTLFFENQLFLSARHDEAGPAIKILQDTTLKDEEKKKTARAEFSKVNDKVIAWQDGLVAKHPLTLTARILKSGKTVEIPPAPKKPDGSIDSSFQLRYYRMHYFDNFDLSDDALLRLPKGIYQDKIKEYLDKLFIPVPDSITKAIDGMIAVARKNPETYKYLVATCAFFYQQPDIMGLDQVFVNIYNKYFASGAMDYWVTPAVKKSYKELAEKISRAQIGTVAPNLMMQDQNLQPRSLYDIKKKYTIIFFFDPDCGHCRQESPKLVSFYNKNKVKYDLEVFAVSSDTSIKKLKNYIQEMKMTWITVDGPRSYLPEHYTKLYFAESFPAIYILDEKKKVIARKLSVDKIDLFLINYEKFKKAAKS